MKRNKSSQSNPKIYHNLAKVGSGLSGAGSKNVSNPYAFLVWTVVGDQDRNVMSVRGRRWSAPNGFRSDQSCCKDPRRPDSVGLQGQAVRTKFGLLQLCRLIKFAIKSRQVRHHEVRQEFGDSSTLHFALDYKLNERRLH